MAQRPEEPVTDEEISAFRRAIEELRVRVSQFVAEDTEEDPDEIMESVNSYPQPDPEEFEKVE